MVPFWLGIIGTRGRWLFKKSCFFWKAQEAPSCEIDFLWNYSSFLDEVSLTARVIESGPKPRDHSIPSSETEKTMLLYSRLKLYELRMQMISWLHVSTNLESARLCHEWNDFFLLWQRFGCAWLWLAENLLQKWRWFSFFVIVTVFLAKHCVPSPPRKVLSVFNLNGNFSTWGQALHFL